MRSDSAKWTFGLPLPERIDTPLKTPLTSTREPRTGRAAPAARGDAERRSSNRRNTIDISNAMMNGAVVKLVDLSTTGAQILSSTLLAPGRLVILAYEDGSRIVEHHAAVVWGTFESARLGAMRYRAGLQFVEAPTPPGPTSILRAAPHKSEPAAGVSILHPPADPARGRSNRVDRQELPLLASVRLPWGIEVNLLNLSNTGMLVETSTKLTPGNTISIELCGTDSSVVVPARFLRSEIVGVDGRGVRYRTAVVFEKEIDVNQLRREADRAVSASNNVAEWLRQLSIALERGGDPDLLRERIKAGLRKLLSARDVDIRNEPVPPPEGCDSIYFTVALEGEGRGVLQITFEPGHAPTDLDFKILQAAAAVTSVMFRLIPARALQAR
jgi:hypothetical protein